MTQILSNEVTSAPKVLIGTDPELFVKDKNGVFFSGHDLIPGDKRSPFRVNKGAIQVDGVALEFNTEPASTKEEFCENISEVIAQMTDIYKKVRPDLDIAIEPTATFDPDYFFSLPQEALLLGCEPDFSAYTGKPNKKPKTTEPFRTGSGHIHVGFGRFKHKTPEHMSLCCALVRQLDAVLFLSSLLWDDDQKRRELYGKIGAFRPKTYGLEYRPMSNRYLSRRAIQEFVFEAAVKATEDFLDGVIYEYENFVFNMIYSINEGHTPDEKEIRSYLRALNDRFGTPLFL